MYDVMLDVWCLHVQQLSDIVVALAAGTHVHDQVTTAGILLETDGVTSQVDYGARVTYDNQTEVYV